MTKNATKPLKVVIKPKNNTKVNYTKKYKQLADRLHKDPYFKNITNGTNDKTRNGSKLINQTKKYNATRVLK